MYLHCRDPAGSVLMHEEPCPIVLSGLRGVSLTRFVWDIYIYGQVQLLVTMLCRPHPQQTSTLMIPSTQLCKVFGGTPCNTRSFLQEFRLEPCGYMYWGDAEPPRRSPGQTIGLKMPGAQLWFRCVLIACISEPTRCSLWVWCVECVCAFGLGSIRRKHRWMIRRQGFVLVVSYVVPSGSDSQTMLASDRMTTLDMLVRSETGWALG